MGDNQRAGLGCSAFLRHNWCCSSNSHSDGMVEAVTSSCRESHVSISSCSLTGLLHVWDKSFKISDFLIEAKSVTSGWKWEWRHLGKLLAIYRWWLATRLASERSVHQRDENNVKEFRRVKDNVVPCKKNKEKKSPRRWCVRKTETPRAVCVNLHTRARPDWGLWLPTNSLCHQREEYKGEKRKNTSQNMYSTVYI